MSAFKNDGTIPYGSRVLSIAAVSYVADNIEVQRPSKTIERTNEIDEPSGQVSYAGFVTGTATLQLATTSTAQPAAGAEFSATFDSGIGSETFYVTDVGRSESKESEKKVNISFRKKYN